MSVVLWVLIVLFILFSGFSFWASGYWLGRMRENYCSGIVVASVLRNCQEKGILGKPGTDGDPYSWDNHVRAATRPGIMERFLLRWHSSHGHLDPDTGLHRH